MSKLVLLGFISICVHAISAVQFSTIKDEVKGEDYRRLRGGAPLKYMSEFHKEKAADGCASPIEQVHITFGDEDNSIIVSFASFVYIDQPEVRLITGPGQAISFPASSAAYSSQLAIGSSLLYNPSMGAPFTTQSSIMALENSAWWAKDPVTGEHYAQWMNVTTWKQAIQSGLLSYKNPFSIYDSPILYTATITGLTPGTTYDYTIKSSCASDVYSVKIPAATYPTTIGLFADVGITTVSYVSMSVIGMNIKPDWAVLVGDLCYADGWVPIWDSFGRAMQNSGFPHIPLVTAGGNHEMSSAESWQHYQARWPTAHKKSGSPSHEYYGLEIGVVNLITLNSYAGTHNGTLQYQWLLNYLDTKVNRERTPWLFVQFHTPWYNSNSGHWKESELMRNDMEELLYNAGVDLVLTGHIHAYERTQPVYKGQVDPCGPVHLVIGDAGNYEGPYTPWRTAESWVGFREASFGVARFVATDANHAQLSWHRHACGSSSAATQHMNFSTACVTPGDNSAQNMLTVDDATLVRPPKATCPNKYYGSAPVWSKAAPTVTPTSSPISKPVKKPHHHHHKHEYKMASKFSGTINLKAVK